MAKMIHRLWQDGNNDLLIMPGSVPLYDGATRNELLYYLPQGWDPVVERDIDGNTAETAMIENKRSPVWQYPCLPEGGPDDLYRECS